MQADEGLTHIFYVKPISNNRDFASEVLLARGLSAPDEGDVCREMQVPGARGKGKGNFK